MKPKVIGVIAAVLVMVGFFVTVGMTQIDEGNRGVMKVWGKVTGEPLTPGFYTYNRFAKDIVEMNVQERKVEGQTEAFTRDTQKVTVDYTLTFYPDPLAIGRLYSQFGENYANVIIPQVVLGSMKDTIGGIIADDLVGKRESVRSAAFNEIQNVLKGRSVYATRLDLTNINFDPNYEKAVEDKVVAIQHAAEAKNKTVQVEEQAKQTVMTANADAEAMRIKTQALKENKALVDYEAVKKWNGVLPQYILGGGAVPFVNLSELGK